MKIHLMIWLYLMNQFLPMTAGMVSLTSTSEAKDGEPYTMSCTSTNMTSKPRYWYRTTTGSVLFATFSLNKHAFVTGSSILTSNTFNNFKLSYRLISTCNDTQHNVTIQVLNSSYDNGSIWWCYDQEYSNTLTIVIKSSPTSNPWGSSTTTTLSTTKYISAGGKETTFMRGFTTSSSPLAVTKSAYPSKPSRTTSLVIDKPTYHTTFPQSEHSTLAVVTVKSDLHKNDDSNSTTKYIIAASVCGGIVLIVVAIVAICCIRRTSSNSSKSEISTSSALGSSKDPRNATLQMDAYTSKDNLVMEDNVLYGSSAAIVDAGKTGVGGNVQDIYAQVNKDKEKTEKSIPVDIPDDLYATPNKNRTT